MIPALLFTYCLLFSLTLTGIAVSRPLSEISYETTLLFLPVTFYFLRTLYLGIGQNLAYFSPKEKRFYHFRLSTFLNQRSTAFTLTFLLFILSLVVLILRVLRILPL